MKAETKWCCEKHRQIFEKAAKEFDPYDPLHAVCSFIEERVELGRAYRVVFTDLYDMYAEFCEEKHYPVETKRTLSILMSSAIQYERTQRSVGGRHSVTVYQGIRLRAAEE
ncbi:MAG: hypothetical protein LN413_00360 [Candidatus Thermoplasmatota archaeon]|nr:hypothetical protein [Candidatus Thermoplasmatota archaeon]